MTETPNPNIVDTDTLTGEMHPIRRCVLALGSNLGDRLNYLQGALASLADTPEVWVTEVSPVYETEPVDAPEGSKKFLNAVVLADTTLSARTLLDRALAIQEKTLSPTHPMLADTVTVYGSVLRKLKRKAEAELMERRAKGFAAKPAS